MERLLFISIKLDAKMPGCELEWELLQPTKSMCEVMVLRLIVVIGNSNDDASDWANRVLPVPVAPHKPMTVPDDVGDWIHLSMSSKIACFAA
ncbi:Hypothetical protein MVR_LOCUS277 [uncultured virus]|nr:Hypothetical protein MVR_LOCUS277 [uncultured virus]